MPNHRTSHPTDGDGIGRKLKDLKLCKRLAELKECANKHHVSYMRSSQTMLQHAKHAGEALIEAKRRLGHRRKWSRWRNANFDGSKETSCHYMRVAREWEQPEIVELRQNGQIKSINSFLTASRRKNGKQTEKSTLNLITSELIVQIRKGLNDLTETELQTIHSNFKDWWEPSLKRIDLLNDIPIDFDYEDFGENDAPIDDCQRKSVRQRTLRILMGKQPTSITSRSANQ